MNLDMSGQQVDCTSYGIFVGSVGGPPVNHVSISNGTVNAIAQTPNQGLQIYVGSTHISVQNLDVTDLFSYNADSGLTLR